jgi:hypothetical protein
LGHIGIVVNPGERLVGFPDEEHAHGVETQLCNTVEISGTGTREEWRYLGIAREIDAPENNHAPFSIDEVPPFGAKQRRRICPTCGRRRPGRSGFEGQNKRAENGPQEESPTTVSAAYFCLVWMRRIAIVRTTAFSGCRDPGTPRRGGVGIRRRP